MQKHLLITILSISLTSVAVAETGYRIVNPDGSVEFSDTYRPGAVELKLPKAQGYQAPALQQPDVQSAEQASEDTAKTMEYQSVVFTAPQNDETIWFDVKGMNIRLQIEPGLAEGHQVVVKLDGQEVGRGPYNVFTLGNIDRGTHSLSASIVDDKGAELKSSSPVTFHFRQHTAPRFKPN